MFRITPLNGVTFETIYRLVTEQKDSQGRNEAVTHSQYIVFFAGKQNYRN